MKFTNTRQIDDYMWPAPRLLLASARPMGSRYGRPGFRGAAAARRASSARVHQETVHCQLLSHTYSGYPSYHSLSCGVAIAWTLLSTQVRNSIIFDAHYRGLSRSRVGVPHHAYLNTNSIYFAKEVDGDFLWRNPGPSLVSLSDHDYTHVENNTKSLEQK